ncbi:MAG: xylulokinase [Phycisphaerales bacterium]
MKHFIGIDIGTSATKALVIDAGGRFVAAASSDHTLSQPRPGWSEQAPSTWWHAACDAARSLLNRVDPASIDGIGLSGQMHGLVLLSERALAHAADPTHPGEPDDPLRPAILWNDQRTADECAHIERALGGDGGRAEMVRLVGNAALTGFTAPKLLWVRAHEPGIFAQARALCMPKDFVALRLTGSLATDVGDASGTLLFEPARRAWSDRALQRLGIPPSLLPPVLESTRVVGRVTRWASDRTGLREGTPVVIGSGDNMTSAVGAGVVAQGDVAAVLGTSGVIVAHADTPIPDLASTIPGRTHLMCSATGAWCVTGCMLAAGGCLRWFRDTLAPGVPYASLMHEASAIAPGADGLIFLPYLTGERCPHPDPLARAAFIGLTARHTRAHMIRAIIEGVSFSMAQILDILRSQGARPACIRLTGGGAKSPLWRQVLCDLAQCPLVINDCDEGPALGAAILAGVGAGHWDSPVRAAREVVRESSRTNPGNPSAYAASRRVFESLYESLRPANEQLSRVEHGTSPP